MGRIAFIPVELVTGTFSLAEARAAGLTHSALRGRSWQRLGPRLYRHKDAPEDNLNLIIAFRRILPPAAVFVGRTAAWLHGLDVDPINPVEVTLGCDSELRSRPGLRVRHCDVSGETQEIRGIQVTHLTRTLLDLCAQSSPVESLSFLDMALKSRKTSPERLQQYAKQATGRRGAGRLTKLARLAAPAESPMETRLRWLLIESGLPAPEVQVSLHDPGGRFLGRVDLYYPSARLVIEFDGGNHRERMTSDNRRQNGLIAAGYRVLRFTTSDVLGRPEAVVGQVRAGCNDLAVSRI